VPWPCVQPSPSRTPQSIYVPCESVSSYAWFASKQQQEQAPTVSDTAAVMCDVKLIQGCINICLFHYKFTWQVCTEFLMFQASPGALTTYCKLELRANLLYAAYTCTVQDMCCWTFTSAAGGATEGQEVRSLEYRNLPYTCPAWSTQIAR